MRLVGIKVISDTLMVKEIVGFSWTEDTGAADNRLPCMHARNTGQSSAQG